MKSPLLIIGTLLVLLLAGALATPFFMDWSTYRAEIENYGRKLIGRDVRIAGDIDIQFLPLPTLTLENVRVANAETSSSPLIVSVKKLQARFLLAPLLRGQVQVHSVLLDRPEIDIERLASGSGNWHFKPSEHLAKIMPLSGLSLEQTRLVNGTIYVSDHRRGGRARLQNVNLTISAGSLKGPFQVRGDVSYEDEPVAVSISTGKFRPDGSMRLGIRLKPQTGNRLQYSFDGKLLGAQHDSIASGVIKIAPPPIAETVKSSPLTNFERLPFLLTSNVEISDEKLSFNKIELALDQSNAVTNAVSGNAEIMLGYDIGFSADLSTRRLDLDALARDLGTNVAQKLKSAVSLDTLEALTSVLPAGVYGRVQLAAGQLVTNAAVIEAGRLDLRVTGTGVRVSGLSGLLPGRTRFELSGLYLPDPVTPQFNGTFAFNALDGRGFLNWMRPGLYGEESGRIGRLKLAGALSATPEHGRINEARFEFDGGSGKGSLFWARSGAPFIEVSVESENLDLTSVMPRGRQSGLLDGPELIQKLNTSDAPIGLDMKIGQLVFANRALKDFVADVKFSPGNLDIRRLAATVGERGKIDLAGSIAGAKEKLKGEVSGKVNSPDAIGMLQVLGAGDLPPQLRALLDGEPLDIWLEYVSGVEKSQLSIEGLAGAGLIGLVLEVDGPLAQWRKVPIDVDGVFETSRAHRVLAALGTGSGEVAPSAKADATISLLASGALGAGLSTTLKAQILGGSLDIDAQLKDPGSGLLAEGTIKFKATETDRLAKALGAGVAVNGQAAFSGKFKGDAKGYQMSDVVIALPGIDGSFEGALAPRGGDWHLSGAGRFQTLDLAPALGLLVLGPPLGAADERVFWADRPFRSAALEGLSGDVRVSAEKLVLANRAVVTGASFTAMAGDGKLALSNIKGRLHGGAVTGQLALQNVEGSNLEVQAKLDVVEANLSQILRDGQGQAVASGKVSISGKLEGRGRSPGGIISVLEGKGDWQVLESKLLGTDPGGFVRSLDGVEDPARLEGLIASGLSNGVWTFSAASSQWVMQSGLLRFLAADVTSDAAAGRLGGFSNVANGETTVFWDVELGAIAGAPVYQVKLSGLPGQLERSQDTASLRSFLVVQVLQESMRKLEELQREQERLYQERQKEKEAADAEEKARKMAEKREVERKAAEESARRQAREFARRAVEEAVRKKTEEAERKALEEAERKAEEQAIRRKIEEEAARRAATEAAARKTAEQLAAEAEARRKIDELAAEAVAAQAREQQEKRLAAARRRAEEREARRKAAEDARAALAAAIAADARRAAQEAANSATLPAPDLRGGSANFPVNDDNR